jgi:Acetyltransferase (GNAT) domain
MTPTTGDHVEVRVKGRWVAVPATEINGNKLFVKGKWLKIAAIRSQENFEKELEAPELYIEKLKHNKNHALKADIFTFTQKIPNTEPKYSYPVERESIAAVHLVSFKAWWESLPQESRKNVRRAQKRGLQVRVSEFDDDLIQGIRRVNDDTPMRQGLANAYYGRSFEETKERYSEFIGRCDFICAYFGEELVGFLHLIYRGDVASILNLTTKPSESDKRPANALMAKAAEICEAKGISYITYGRYNYGNKQHSPLREFKIRNGFEEILVPRYFVPLTPWGRVCMKANLHRGLVGILPHSVITVGVSARSLWYDFRASMSRCSSTLERPTRTRQMERSIPPAGSNSTIQLPERHETQE